MTGVRVDGILPKVAAEIGVEITGTLGGGEFGAVLVCDREGRDLVLKAFEGVEWAPVFANGAAMCTLVRGDDYPAPEYIGTGVAAGATWSLQTLLPGEIPERMSDAHAAELLRLVRRHADASDREGDTRERFRRVIGDAGGRLVAHEPTASLATRMLEVIAATEDVALRRCDVVHGDFHHRNFLAVGDEITGVFDWEMASAGDWRADLVNLACWSSWLDQVPDSATRIFVDAVEEACEPEVLALLSASHTLGVLDFNLRVHPEWLPDLVANVEATTARWL